MGIFTSNSRVIKQNKTIQYKEYTLIRLNLNHINKYNHKYNHLTKLKMTIYIQRSRGVKIYTRKITI